MFWNEIAAVVIDGIAAEDGEENICHVLPAVL